MNVPSPDELVEAERWLEEAGQELAVATLIASAPELPGRVVCFHAHLAAEKALKALQIRRGILVRKVHNLVELLRELPANDQGRFEHNDLNLLNPWTIRPTREKWMNASRSKCSKRRNVLSASSGTSALEAKQ